MIFGGGQTRFFTLGFTGGKKSKDSFYEGNPFFNLHGIHCEPVSSQETKNDDDDDHDHDDDDDDSAKH